MPWTVRIPKAVEREMDELPDDVREEAIDTIHDLEEDPFQPGSIQLRNHTNLYRVRFFREAYRITYLVFERQKKIVLTRVRHRRDVYEGL